MTAVEVNESVWRFFQEVEASGGKPAVEHLNDVLHAYGAQRGFAAAAPATPERHAAHAKKGSEIVVTFRLISRAPLTEDLPCEPFGRASEVVLLAAADATLPIGRLVGLRVSVPVSDDALPGRVVNGHHTLAGTLRMPEVEHAHEMLRHTLAILRLKGMDARFSPYEDGMGQPVLVAERGFEDGLPFYRPLPFSSPRSVYVDIGLDELLHHVVVDAGLLASLWEKRRAQVALLRGGPELEDFALFQRASLVIESRYPKTKRKGSKKSGPPSEVIHLIQSFGTAADSSNAAAQLYDLRDEVSHLQRQAASGALVPEPYGLDPHDPTLLKRVEDSIPLALDVAWHVITGRPPTRRTSVPTCALQRGRLGRQVVGWDLLEAHANPAAQR